MNRSLNPFSPGRSLSSFCFWIVVIACSVITTNARADYESAVLADNPLGYWRFNEADGDTAADLGSGGNEGEYFGGQRIPAESFNILDGRQVSLGAGNLAFQVGEDVDEYMQVVDPILSDLEQFTMSAWVNPGPRDGNRIGLFGQNDALEFGFINPNLIQMWTPSGQVLNYTIDPVNQIPEDTWFHLATVGTGSNIELYINGEAVTPGPSYGDSAFPFNIAGGGIYDPTGNQLTGTVDEVAVFTKALTDAQLEAHVAAAKAAGGDYAATVLADGPLGYWGFDDAGDAAVNQGTGGDDLNGSYIGGDRDATGANETLPGVQGAKGFAGESPDDGYVSIESPILSGLGEFTLSGFVKPGDIFDNRVGLFGQNDAMEFGFINPTTIQMWTPLGGNVNFEILDEVVEGEWVHIAAVGDGEEIRVYIDGEEVAVGGNSITGAPVASYGASEFPFSVGGGGVYDDVGNQFTGILDEVAVWDTALSPAQIAAQFAAALADAGVAGDYNGNGERDVEDIDILSDAVRNMDSDAKFDLNGDGNVDAADRTEWVEVLTNTYYGDSNFDGEFSSADFVAVFVPAKYETGEAAGWAEGDWNGDAQFTSSDFVAAFIGAGYENGPREGGIMTVPEPSGFALLLFGTIGLQLARRRR